MPLFHGVVPPVVTPAQSEISTSTIPSFTRVLEHLIDGGVHGALRARLDQRGGVP